MKKQFIVLLSCCLFTSSCALISPCGITKDDFLKNYHAFVRQFEDKQLNYEDAAWQSYDKDFEQLVKECYPKFEAEMSITEKVDFWTDALLYYYYRYGKGIITALNDNSNEVSVIIMENVDKFIDNPEKVLRKILGNSVIEGLEDLLNDMGNDIRNWGKKLEQIFEN